MWKLLKKLFRPETQPTPKPPETLAEREATAMERVYLHRLREDGIVTLGVIVYRNAPVCVTLEEPDLDNQAGISNIPEGEYPTARVISPNFGDCFGVEEVPGRSLIRIHAGNTTDDTRGCILPGLQFGKYVGNRPMVISSRKALDKMKALLPRRFTLVITNMDDTSRYMER